MEVPTNLESKRVFKLVLTGGPCAGKTTFLDLIKTRLEAFFDIICVPEVGVLTTRSGVDMFAYSDNYEAQKSFLKQEILVQMHLEDYFEAFGKYNKRQTIMVCDRGTSDCWAFGSLKLKEDILAELNMTEAEIGHQRYDMAINIVTAAYGAPSFYKTVGLERTQNVEQAINLELAIQECWRDHPNFVLINNDVKDFNEKAEAIIESIMKGLGVSNKKLTRKYLIKTPQLSEQLIADLKLNSFEETMHFLTTSSAGMVAYVTEIAS